jgi:hypothetical protein
MSRFRKRISNSPATETVAFCHVFKSNSILNEIPCTSPAYFNCECINLLKGKPDREGCFALSKKKNINLYMNKGCLHKIAYLLLLCICNEFVVMAQTKLPVKLQGLLQSFKTPPDSVKPGVYWYWLNDNITREGVKKDIEAMAKVGIGRAFVGNIGLSKDDLAFGKVKLFSAEWWAITRTAISTATKEGVDIGLFNSPGWSQSGGPWIKPSQSMRYLSGDELNVKGPMLFSQKLSPVKANYQDVAVLAFPVPESEGADISKYSPLIHSDLIFDDLQKLVDGNMATGATATSVIKDTTVAHIDIETSNSFTARSLAVYPLEKSLRADIELQVKEGDSYRSIKKFVFDRTNAALNVGFTAYAPVVVSFDAINAKQFRLVLSHMNEGAGFAEIKLSTAPLLERFPEKQLAKMLQTPFPLWGEYQWAPQVEVMDKSLLIDPAKVIDLTKNLTADGTLNWNVPSGNWIIIRYGMLPTGVTNSPAPPEGQGLEIDKISKAAMQEHFDAFVGKIQKSIPAAERRSLKWVVADSYETGSQNWTDGMSEIFKKRYGYNPLPWLPVLSGRIVGSADQSDRFLWDIRRMVADLVAYEYVGGLREVSNRNGLKLWLENYGHWGYPSEFLMYGGQSDEVAGEFWNEGELGNIECRAASSAAHIYGKTKVSAESFTAGGAAFERYPAMLKKRGDWSFTEGINNSLLHVYIEQPYDSINPGLNAWFGTEFNRKNTWFFQGKAFIDYIRRCNFLLQQGKPVNDVAYFISEDAPKMTGTRDPELPLGYSYDYINAEVLLKRVSVKNGELVLPDGMRYRMLVLPKLETMRPELLKKIGELVKQGITILGPSPKRSPSLENYPEADSEIEQTAKEIWGDADRKNQFYTKFGKGNVLTCNTMREALDFIRLVPDVVLKNRDVLFTHRTTKDGEIYFLTNQTDKTIELSPVFRVTGKQPEWWDAVTGKNRTLTDFTNTTTGTIVPLKLEAYQSGFVLFSKNAVPSKGNNKNNFPVPDTLLLLSNPWLVSFDTAKRGPSAPVVFNLLADWSLNNSEQIKNYSGTAIYTTTFSVRQIKKDEKFCLDLGMVSVMGKVKLNGVDLGTVWTAPYKVDVSKAIKTGENKLEVEVVNTWVNRMIGDSKLPADLRKTWSNVNTFTPESKYQQSGLIGPVTLQTVKF